MLPEFPRAHDAIQKVWNRILFNAAGFSDPLVSQLTVRVQREGDRAFIGESETEYKAHQVSHGWQPEIGRGIPTEEFFSLPQRLGKEMAEQQAKIVFAAMSEPSPHTGTLDESEGPLTFELLLKKMEGFELDFDENGMPRWPQWFVSKEVFADVQAMSQVGLTPEQAQRQMELVVRKRKEFDERENRRRLVE